MVSQGLAISLYRHGRGIERVGIVSRRPLKVATLFENRSPEQIVDVAPLIFSVCAAAQGCAAVKALERAGGQVSCHAMQAAREALVLVEAAREHLLRIILTWPRFLPNRHGPEAKWATRLVPEFSRIIFDDCRPFAIGLHVAPDHIAFLQAVEELRLAMASTVYGEPVDVFLARHDTEALTDWALRGDTVAARLIARVIENNWSDAGNADAAFLPDLDDMILRQWLDSREAGCFIPQPDRNGVVQETTALARRRSEPLIAALMASFGTGLLTRMAARLTELARIPGELRACAQRFENRGMFGKSVEKVGVGVAQVEAARGRLIHGARIERNRITRYHILAPTEWNFHPQGVAARALGQLKGRSDEELTVQAKLLIDAIDPCVDYELRLH